MRNSPILAIILALLTLSLPACDMQEESTDSGDQKIVVTSPRAKDVIITQPYVCQIHSQQHINVRAMMSGYLEEILVREGQVVKKNQLMFRILPILYKAKLDAEMAELELAKLELKYTESLFNQKPPVVSENEVFLYRAKVQRAKAKADLAEAEWKFTEVRARFDGIIDRLQEQLGSLIKERDILTTLSDNSLMWVYFNVPEARYIEYQKSSDQVKKGQRIELVLANGTKFPSPSTGLTVEARFNNETGTVPFRADFPNKDRLLRHGMTGTILVHRTLKNATIIPQRATFEILDKRYVFVIDEKKVVHQQEIFVEHELPDIYVIKKGLTVYDRFVFEGIRQVRDGKKVEYEFLPLEKILGHQEFHAE